MPWTDLLLWALEQAHFGTKSAEKICKLTLRRGQHELNNVERQTIARRFFGVCQLKIRLEYMAQFTANYNNEDVKQKYMRLVTIYVIHEEPKYFAPTEPTESWRDFASSHWIECQKINVEWPATVNIRLQAMYSIPNWLVETILQSTSSLDEAEKLANSLNYPGQIYFRCNLSKCAPEELISLLRTKENVETRQTFYSPVGLVVSQQEKPEIHGNSLYQKNLFEVQDEGSQLISLATGVKPGMKVLDFCSGRGGKALHLLDMLKGRGLLACHDVSETVLKKAQYRLEKNRYGDVVCKYVCSNHNLESVNGGRGGDEVAKILDGNAGFILNNRLIESSENQLFDIVLVDAPCSSLGTLRRGPNVRHEIQFENLGVFPALQKNILSQAASLVNPGGILVYATCTFVKQEGILIKEWFDEQHKDFVPDPLSNAFGNELMGKLLQNIPNSSLDQSWIQLLPFIHGTDAFFISRWKRVIL